MSDLVFWVVGFSVGYLVLSQRRNITAYFSAKQQQQAPPLQRASKQPHSQPLNNDEDDEEDGDRKTNAYAEESQNLLSLLYSIAEDQSRKEGYVHRSVTCNHCGTSPIRGYRFRCANCVDYDLCESCEALDVHIKTHVFVKIKIPIPPLANPRTSLLSPFYPGITAIAHSLGVEFSTRLNFDFSNLQKTTHFDQVELEAFFAQFRSLSTIKAEPGGITRETFELCLGPLGLEKNLIAERIFAFFDQNGDKIISFPELVQGMSILCKGSLDERIKYAFSGYDIDGDGFISRSELHKMFKAYFHLSMELVRDVVKTMEEGMMESFDDEASKPVSASFSAPIPPSNRRSEDDENDEASGSGKKKGSGSEKRGDASGSLMFERTPTTTQPQQSRSPSLGSPTVNAGTLIGMGSRTFRPVNTTHANNYVMQASPTRPDSPSHNRPASPISYEDITTASLRSGRPLSAPTTTTTTTLPHLPYARERLGSILQDPNSLEEHWPVMEAMSQDAINEMVEKTFASAGAVDSLSFEDFKKVVENDSNMLAWFEALGSVF